VLQIENLNSSLFGPVSLSVAAGECVSIVGASGSGKSLFLRAIADLDPNEGWVRLNGKARSERPADKWRKRVALVPSESGWWTDDVGDHFEFCENPAPMLAAVGLQEALGWHVSRLSSGEKHRLAIVRAICAAPEVILLDEPTATLDQAATMLVEDLIRAQCERGAAVILVTHDQAQSERLASRRYQMVKGTMVPVAEAVS